MATQAEILAAIQAERARQDAKWGVQDHPSVRGTTWALNMPSEHQAKARCDAHAKAGDITYADIALEEFCEVVDARDDVLRREELIQLAAVCVAWIESIDRRG